MRGQESHRRRVYGSVTTEGTGEPMAGLRVRAMDADLLFDDVLGEDTTDKEGRYAIEYGVEDFRDLLERAPDIYLVVEDVEGRTLADTREAVVRDAGPDREINVQVPIDDPRREPLRP